MCVCVNVCLCVIESVCLSVSKVNIRGFGKVFQANNNNKYGWNCIQLIRNINIGNK